MEPVGPEGIRRGTPSPDGKSFVARSQSGWSIFPMSATGEGRPVSSMTLKDYVIRWNLDGSALYCFQRATIPASLDRIDMATERRESIASLGEQKEAGLVSILHVSLADDLRSIVYGSSIYTSVLYTVASDQ
jgi:hypothetical protein